MSNTLESSVIINLNRLFKKKGWENYPDFEESFDRFCGILEKLDNSQQALILELIERYLWIEYNTYLPLLRQAVQKLEFADNIRELVVCPALRPEDEKDISLKSGHRIATDFKASHIRRLAPLVGKKITVVFSSEGLSENSYYKENNANLIIVDDFIGTGETVGSLLTNLGQKEKLCPDSTIVFALAVMDKGLRVIGRENIRCFYGQKVLRGIGDYYEDEELESKRKEMEDIETMMNEIKDCFGYNGSQALVTIFRTADNTFPVFWKQPESEIWSPPFERM